VKKRVLHIWRKECYTCEEKSVTHVKKIRRDSSVDHVMQTWRDVKWADMIHDMMQSAHTWCRVFAHYVLSTHVISILVYLHITLTLLSWHVTLYWCLYTSSWRWCPEIWCLYWWYTMFILVYQLVIYTVLCLHISSLYWWCIIFILVFQRIIYTVVCLHNGPTSCQVCAHDALYTSSSHLCLCISSSRCCL